MITDLSATLGSRLVACLTTAGHRAAAAEVFDLIAADNGPHVARAWLVGRNPDLGDTAPLLAIADGRAADVIAAARAYTEGAIA